MEKYIFKYSHIPIIEYINKVLRTYEYNEIFIDLLYDLVYYGKLLYNNINILIDEHKILCLAQILYTSFKINICSNNIIYRIEFRYYKKQCLLDNYSIPIIQNNILYEKIINFINYYQSKENAFELL